jgi:23S rRNA pseudouridine1911/1915/1917 synthase
LVGDWLGGRVGRRQLAAMLAAGEVSVNGRRAVKGTLLQRGDEVTIRALPASFVPLIPERLDVPILHVDATVVVVDKPPGMPSTGGGRRGPSVAAALLHRFPEMAAIDARRAAGLVHRLDTGTSGLLIAARTPAAYRNWRLAFAHKRIEKDYLAVVRGTLSMSGSVERPLARRARGRGRMVPAPDATEAWTAGTDYTPIHRGRGFTLVALRMRTGVTHQLRVHMALLGHPIVGDRRYGPDVAQADVVEPVAIGASAWHYLHALRVRVDDPSLAAGFEAPFPAHWRPLFRWLGWPTTTPHSSWNR